MSRYGKKHKSFYTVTLGNMTTTNISKAHTENNRMSGYREAGGREEGREEGRERHSLASSQGPTLIPSTANKINHYTNTIFMAFEMQGCGHMTLILPYYLTSSCEGSVLGT